MKTILVDPSLCIQCCDCQIACKDEHCDNDWRPIAASQSEGQFWIQVREKQAGHGMRMRQDRVPVMCQHCASCKLVEIAPDVVYRREDGIVIIDPEKAKGREDLVAACPYHTVYWNGESEIPQKCTMCAHLLDAGWEMPRCVAACPRDALRYVDVADLVPEKMYAPTERLHAKYGTSPSVAYVNLPKPFVAGSVYDPTHERLLDGVQLVLTNEATGQAWHGETDFLGEFKVEGVEEGFYSLYLRKPGYGRKQIQRLEVRDGLNCGDIKLYATPE